MRKWLVIGVATATLVAVGGTIVYGLIDRPRLATYGRPAVSVQEIDQRLRPYRSGAGVETAPVVSFSLYCDKQPADARNCGGYHRYLGCKEFSDNDTFQPSAENQQPTTTPPEGTPRYSGNIRVRAGWNPVRINAWSMPDDQAATRFAEQVRHSARSCAGRNTSDGESGERDYYDLGVAEYAKDGWRGAEVSVNGEIGDEDSVNSSFPPGSHYTYGTVIAARGRLIVRLTWGKRTIPWYSPTSLLRRRGEASVTAILHTIGG